MAPVPLTVAPPFFRGVLPVARRFMIGYYPTSPAERQSYALIQKSARSYGGSLVAGAPLIIDTRNAIKREYPHVFRLGAPQPQHAAVWSADAMTTTNIEQLGAQ